MDELVIGHPEETAIGAVLGRDLGGDEDPRWCGQAAVGQPQGGLPPRQRAPAVTDERERAVEIRRQGLEETVGQGGVGLIVRFPDPVLPAGRLQWADLDLPDVPRPALVRRGARTGVGEAEQAGRRVVVR